MKILPPGNILQNLYIKKRLKGYSKKTFLEIGSGNGFLSNELLSIGLTGIGCDLNRSACLNNQILNKKDIEKGYYKVIEGDFLNQKFKSKFDIIISSMVIEHLEDKILESFIAQIKELLLPDGKIIFLVPSSMKYWGIEDDIAGHVKRYEYEDFTLLSKNNSLQINHLAGLTYPLSNWLFKLSNRIVKKNESDKLALNELERTVYTGNRDVLYKTKFPFYFKLFFNEIVMYPFYLLQLLNLKNKNCMIIYCELKLI
jgi:SAM-dependent methyltransferase